MAPGTKMAINERVSKQEGLGLSRRFEALHLPFPPRRRSMRVFAAVVEVTALPVLDGRQRFAAP
jgi:hypothetical protein